MKMEEVGNKSERKIPTFREFLETYDGEKRAFPPEPVVPMNLDPKNPGTQRLILNTAKRILRDHRTEIEALKDR